MGPFFEHFGGICSARFRDYFVAKLSIYLKQKRVLFGKQKKGPLRSQKTNQKFVRHCRSQVLLWHSILCNFWCSAFRRDWDDNFRHFQIETKSEIANEGFHEIDLRACHGLLICRCI